MKKRIADLLSRIVEWLDPYPDHGKSYPANCHGCDGSGIQVQNADADGIWVVTCRICAGTGRA